MAALTAEAKRQFPTTQFEKFFDFELSNVKVWEGAAVGETSGYVRALVSGDAFRGFAMRTVDNSAGSAGDKRLRVRKEGHVVLNLSGATRDSIGEPVFATSDNDFSLTKTEDDSYIGYVVDCDASANCVVYFNAQHTPAAKVAAAAGTDATIINAIVDALEDRGILIPNA